MLKSRQITAALALALGALSCAATQAHAADGPGGGADNCGLYVCVEADTPGSPTGGSDGQDATDGASSSDDKASDSRWTCTYKKADPQPPAGSLDWEGHKPGDGAVYDQACIFDGRDNYTIHRFVWAAEPPAGAGVDPAVLARRAVDKMLLRGPQIGITPKPGGKGVVGMPVYLWTGKSAETYGPNTASASAGGLTVTATAKVSKIVWTMGDGHSVTCTTAGTPYNASYGKTPSPDCGYRYDQPSSTTPSGKWHVTATSTWTIDWQASGGGPTGQLTEIRDSAVDINVAEVQVLN